MGKKPSNTENQSIQGTIEVNFPQANNGARMSVATAGDLCSSVKEQHGHTGDRPAKGHKDNEGMGAPHIRGKRGRMVQPREEKTRGGRITNINKYLKRGYTEHEAGLFPVMPSDWTRCDGHNLKHSGSF